MSKTHRTARGEIVDMDMVRLANEETIAIGNMKTNARGDRLGAGGQVIKTKSEIMQEYHRLNTDIVQHDEPVGTSSKVPQPVMVPGLSDVDDWEEPNVVTPIAEEAPVTATAGPVVETTPVAEAVPAPYVKPRGSFAEAVAKDSKVVEQELLPPAGGLPKSSGISRI